jgi:hypothetical protein
MNITNVQRVPKTLVTPLAEAWYFWLDGTKYLYEARPLETVGDIIVDGTGVTQVFVAYDSTSEMKLTYIGRLNKYLPLDENNPADGISKFYKLMLIQ